MSAPEQLPSGFEFVLHQSLVRPMLIGGAPRRAAILAGTVGAAVGLGAGYPVAGAISWILMHGAAAVAAGQDPRFFDALTLHLRQPRHFRC